MSEQKLHVLCVAYGRPIHLMNICGIFLVQTNPNWELTIMYDGKPPESIAGIMDLYNDPRITFTHSERRKQKWGHPNRKTMLEQVKANDDDIILLTNEDNMYVPIFVEAMLKTAKEGVGFVMCDILHNYEDYKVMEVKLKENYIDMGCFCVRADVAKKVGFNHVNFSADGRYAEDCAKYCKEKKLEILHIQRPLFIHC